MRILLTGSSGYIASVLVPHLQAQEHTVVGLDRRPPTVRALDQAIQADLLDRASVEKALAGVDVILHLAASKADWGTSSSKYHRDNVDATQALIRIGRAAGVRKWLFYSSVASLGPSNVPLDETARFAPTGPYGATKAAAERLFHELAAEDPEAKVVILRPSAVFGRGMGSDANVHRLINVIDRGRFLMVGRGNVVKTTSYIENLVAAHLFVMSRMKRGVCTYIYVDQPALSTGEFVRHICELVNRRPPSWWLPVPIVMGAGLVGDFVSGLTRRDVPITSARIKKFCSSTNYKPLALEREGFRQPVSIEDALRATVQWCIRGRP
jgi:nucleoside-diphosphate-sugar epimerase